MQWGFYFDQSRCLGCKTCMTACKNWNELRRGNARIHQLVMANYTSAEGEKEDKSVYIGEDGGNNYALYRQFYMAENWRRVDTFDRGATTLNSDGSVTSTFDRRYLSVACNHCDDPACVAACPTSNITKDGATGIVLAGNGCLSCGRCREACPWDAPQFYDDIGKYPANDPAAPLMTKCTLCYDRINEGLKPACVAACWNRALDAGPVEDLQKQYPHAVGAVDEFDPNGLGPNILFKGK